MKKARVAAAVALLLVCLSVARADTQPQQVTEIADNLLLYQRDNGGWIENRDPARILDATEKAALVARLNTWQLR